MPLREHVFPQGGSGLVNTGISIEMPAGVYARIAPRSGLAVKNRIAVGGGVIDPDYDGEVKVILFNHGDEDFIVNPGNLMSLWQFPNPMYEGNQIHNFDQCWSILVKFDQFWSVLVKTMALIKFDQI